VSKVLTVCATFVWLSLCSSAFAAPAGLEDLFRGCSNLGSLRSAVANQPISLNVLNKTSRNINIIWINYQGGRQLYRTIGPNQNWNQQTYVTHPWLLTDVSGNCLGAFTTSQSQGVIMKNAPDAAADWGIRSAYDAVSTWGSLNNPTFDCFRRFPQYDMKKQQILYTNAVLFCTTLISIIGYDRKQHYD
jgi:hypothetical protein